MKRSVIVAALAAVALGGCSKEVSEGVESPEANVQSFRDLQVPKGFDFSGTKTIQVKLSGQSGIPANAQSVVTLQDEAGNVLLKYNVNLSNGLDMPLQVKSGTEKLYSIDGAGFKHEISVQNNQLTLNAY